MELQEITVKVDALWASRKKSDEGLAPLLYAAWKVFEGRRGAPRKDSSGATVATFSGYLRERGITQTTAKRLIRSHRVSLGEIPAPVEIPDPEWDEELDHVDQFSEDVESDIPVIVSGSRIRAQGIGEQTICITR
jgi:hypothetical protein